MRRNPDGGWLGPERTRRAGGPARGLAADPDGLAIGPGQTKHTPAGLQRFIKCPETLNATDAIGVAIMQPR